MAAMTHTAPATVGTRRKVGWARARRYVLPLVGLAVLLAFLGPYIVMVLNSLRPSSDVVQTPPTFLPRTWQWSTFGDVLGDQRFVNWLKTSLLGMTFLGFQIFEYHHAYTELGLTLGSGIYGSTFFILTGFHGVHVTLGAFILLIQFFRALRGHFKPNDQFGLEAASWYWHFVDVVWVCLFFFVYVL